MVEIFNLNGCTESERNYSYGGLGGRKDGIIWNNEMWIIKYPKSTKGMKGHEQMMSYTSSPLSEYIGSHIFKQLGIPVHDTVLGVRNDKVVVACKDFCRADEQLLEMRTVFNHADKALSEILDHSSADSSLVNVDIDFIMLQLNNNKLLKKVNGIKERFWKQLIIDAYIHNNDRNYGNWGIIRNIINGEIRIAPVYDNGACLNNKQSVTALIKEMQHPSFDKIASNVATVYYSEGKRLYLKHIFDIEDTTFRQEIKNMIPVIKQNHQKIIQMIQDIPSHYNEYQICSDVQKEYFCRSLDARLRYVLEPAYEK